jgi:diguanylate cyclase (GGDEF)-like protein/PAS domain S-box-containing protein
MRSPKTVVLLEDNPGDARLIQEMFKEYSNHTVNLIHFELMSEAETYFASATADILMLDLGLPDVQGLEAVRRAHTIAPHIPLVILSGLDDESMAIQAMQEGAQDYLIKGQIEPRELLRALRYAIERKLIEETLFAEKERAQVTLDSIGDAVICTDIDGNITFLNRVAELLTGWTFDEAAGQPMTSVFRLVAADTHQTLPGLHQRVIHSNRAMKLPSNSTLIRCDHTELPIEDSFSPIRDRQNQVTGAVVVFRDVSAARAMADQIAHSAEHDFLTGLPNRLLLNDRVTQAIALAERHQYQVAVLFLDLDGFKHNNDSLGHAIGDGLLQSITQRLAECVRAVDTVSRQGGDEFVVLLPAVEKPEDAAIAARRMLEAVARPHTVDHHDLHITASLGISVYPDDGHDAGALVKNADTAMYQAKENGRDSYRFFESAMNVRAVERQSIEENLRRALERNELSLHYQPIINLKTAAITGAEALLRWTHPTLGSISPAVFIPIAEDSGLILPIGAWVLREACTQAQRWIDAGLPQISIAVNVSAVQFRSETFLQDLLAILRETGVSPACLEVEMTESALMKRVESTASILQDLRAEGIKVAIDDFGTGYSSLSYLHKFPLDALKIDQSFVRQITRTPGETTIVTAIISMAQSLNLRLIAEGVETTEEMAFLQARSCDAAQGYHFSRPVPADAFTALLQASLAPPPGGPSTPRYGLIPVDPPQTTKPTPDKTPAYPPYCAFTGVAAGAGTGAAPTAGAGPEAPAGAAGAPATGATGAPPTGAGSFNIATAPGSSRSFR